MAATEGSEALGVDSAEAGTGAAMGVSSAARVGLVVGLAVVARVVGKVVRVAWVRARAAARAEAARAAAAMAMAATRGERVVVACAAVPVGRSEATEAGVAEEAAEEEAVGAAVGVATAAAAVYFGSGAQWLRERRERV